jgi:hypothetical protein
MLGTYPGWIGLHTRGEAPGAYPNGTRVVKIFDEEADTHRIGAKATVLGSIRAPAELREKSPYFYFVEWDAHPRFAVGVVSRKIATEKDR